VVVVVPPGGGGEGEGGLYSTIVSYPLTAASHREEAGGSLCQPLPYVEPQPLADIINSFIDYITFRDKQMK